ncbi:hypothetical protein QQ054_29335 [Oscillatoria amoena NRMC-F 0135]|nr:hypothetical protein [Oscillatoria amoena NRMC-F 0135]
MASKIRLCPYIAYFEYVISPARMAIDKRFPRGGRGQEKFSLYAQYGLYASLKSSVMVELPFTFFYIEVTAGTVSFVCAGGIAKSKK